MDLTQFKRVFTFGCSFTSYIAPTWADIIFQETLDAEHYNFGHSGGGNALISNIIAQANLKYRFCETDLVMVMYTSPLREDRWVDGKWQAWGNIFNQPFYDKNFVKNYCDPIGMVLKDMGTVELCRGYVDLLQCVSIQMLAATVKLDIDINGLNPLDRDKLSRIYTIFNDTLQFFPHLQLPSGNAVMSFPRFNGKEYVKDGHPNPMEYCVFLQQLGIPISDKGLEYALNATEFLLSCKTDEEIVANFPELAERSRIKNEEIF